MASCDILNVFVADGLLKEPSIEIPRQFYTITTLRVVLIRPFLSQRNTFFQINLNRSKHNSTIKLSFDPIFELWIFSMEKVLKNLNTLLFQSRFYKIDFLTLAAIQFFMRNFLKQISIPNKIQQNEQRSVYDTYHIVGAVGCTPGVVVVVGYRRAVLCSPSSSRSTSCLYQKYGKA